MDISEGLHSINHFIWRITMVYFRAFSDSLAPDTADGKVFRSGGMLGHPDFDK